jgi:hypothetical protein
MYFFGGLMKMKKNFAIMTAVCAIAVSGGADAKQNKETRPAQNRGSETSEVNTNRQLRAEENVRGADRAEERHELKDTRETGSSSSEINANKQLKTEEDVRGADRAAERHDLHDTKARTTTKAKKKSKTKKTSGRSQK